MPITPSGTRTLVILRPLASVCPPITLPTGSGRAATWRSPSAIAAMRSGVRRSLSCMDSLMPFSLAACISLLFASIINSVFSTSASAIASSALFFTEAVNTASAPAALCAASALALTNSNAVIFNPPNLKLPNHRGELPRQNFYVQGFFLYYKFCSL